MSTNFPTSLDVLTNPTATNSVTNPSHSAQHANANDSIEALEAKVGIDGSATTTTHDYKLSGVTGSDKAVSKTGTETLTNKTLTTPVIASFYQDAGLTKLMTTPNTASDTLVALVATQSLTNKTITDSTNNVMAKSLKSATTTVDVSAATAPSSGEVLTATSSTTATWQAATAAAYSGASVDKSGTSTLSSNTAATVAWDAENFDTATYHDNATNNSRLTVSSNGYYLITCSMFGTSDIAGGVANLTLLKNGSTNEARSIAPITNDATAPGGISLSTILNLATNDYVEIKIGGTWAGSTLTYGATGSNFTITKIGS